MKKTGIMLALVAMMLVTAMSAMAGTVTMVNPAASDRESGRFVFNATQDFNATWCAFKLYSGDTVNSSSSIWIANVSKVHDTMANNSVNISFNSALFEDATSYTASATCENITSGTDYDSATVGSIVLDNTVPTVPTLNAPDGTTDDDGSLNFNATVAGNQTVTCTLTFLGDLPIGAGTSVSITESSNLCTQVYSGPVGNGAFRYTFTASDGTNTSAPANVRTMIATLDGNRKKSIIIPQQVAEQAGVATSTGMSPITIIALLAAGGYILSQLGKKRK